MDFSADRRLTVQPILLKFGMHASETNHRITAKYWLEKFKLATVMARKVAKNYICRDEYEAALEFLRRAFRYLSKYLFIQVLQN